MKKNSNAKSHIETKYKNINGIFKANLIASRRLFHIDITKIRGVCTEKKISMDIIYMNIL